MQRRACQEEPSAVGGCQVSANPEAWGRSHRSFLGDASCLAQGLRPFQSLTAGLETSFFRHQHFDEPRGVVHAVTADKVKLKPREFGGKLPKPQSLKVTGASDIKFNMILFDPMYPKILSFQHIINIKMLAMVSIFPF